MVDSAQVITSIAQTVFGEIYPSKKYKYGKYDFAYDQYIDETLNGSALGGMRLRIVTVASDYYGAPDQRLIMDSQVNNEAVIVLSNETPYFEELEQAMKIRKYVKQRNVSQLPESIQDIIRKRPLRSVSLRNPLFKFSKFKRKAQENSPGDSRAGSACIGAARCFLSFTLIDARLYGKADRPGENFFCGA